MLSNHHLEPSDRRRPGAPAPSRPAAVGGSAPLSSGDSARLDAGVRARLTHPYDGPLVVASGIDTLELRGRGLVPSRLLDDLLGRREAARSLRQRNGVVVEVAGQPFNLTLDGSERRVMLRNGDATLHLARFDSVETDNLRVKPSAAFLWRAGGAGAIGTLLTLIENVVAPYTPDLWLSRLDLAVDVQGFDFPPHTDPRWVVRARHRARYDDGAQHAGTQFGKGDHLLRHYRKDLELVKSQKAWMRTIWERHGGDPAAPTHRIEVQARREHLRRFGFDRVTRPADVLGRCDALWQHTLSRFLVLHDSARRTRCDRDPVHPVWRRLAEVTFGAPLPAEPLEPDAFSAEQHARAIRGHMASIGAQLLLEDRPACLHAVLEQLDELERREPGKFERLLELRRTRLHERIRAAPEDRARRATANSDAVTDPAHDPEPDTALDSAIHSTGHGHEHGN